jgi:hypothetical protein
VHTVKVGDKCLYSSTFGGLVPVKYTGMKSRQFFDGYHPSFEVIKETGPFKKGENIWGHSFVTPKKLFKKTGMFTYVCTGDFVYEGGHSTVKT